MEVLSQIVIVSLVFYCKAEMLLTDNGMYGGTYMSSLQVLTNIHFRFAHTSVNCCYKNIGNITSQAVFTFHVPKEALISHAAIKIDGVTRTASVQEQTNEQTVNDNLARDPGGQRLYLLKVPIAAHGNVTFTLTYQELLQRSRGRYRHNVYFRTDRITELKVDYNIVESQAINSLKIQPYTADVSHTHPEKDNSLKPIISHPSRTSANIKMEWTKHSPPQAKMRYIILEYDLQQTPNDAELLISDDMFVYFATPKVDTVLPRDVVFILDTSSSMQGHKLQHLKEAMDKILDKLTEGDTFNIIQVNGHMYRKQMIEVSQRQIFKAKIFMRQIQATGWTNINHALQLGLRLLHGHHKHKVRSPMIMFITDGEATAGIQSNDRILKKLKGTNLNKVPIYCMALGMSADWKLVSNIAKQQNGVARRIHDDENTALQIEQFFNDISEHVVRNLTITFNGESFVHESVTKSNFRTINKGTEVIVAGKINSVHNTSFGINMAGDTRQGIASYRSSCCNTTTHVKYLNYSEELKAVWMFLNMKQLLKAVLSETNKHARDLLLQEAVNSSIQYGLLTTLTSMVFVKSTADEDFPHRKDENISLIQDEQEPIDELYHFMSDERSVGGGAGGDPHYMVRIAGLEHPVCFDVGGREGDIHNLLTDPYHGVLINAQLIKSMTINRHGHYKTFIGKLAIKVGHQDIIITNEDIVVDEQAFGWHKELSYRATNFKIFISHKGHKVSLRLNFGPEILVVRHNKHSKNTNTYLNVYIQREDRFSNMTTGLIGQFVNSHKHVKLKEVQTKNGRIVGKLQITDLKSAKQVHVIRTHLIERHGAIKKETVLCWIVHKKFANYFYGHRQHFGVPNILPLDV